MIQERLKVTAPIFSKIVDFYIEYIREHVYTLTS
jgi:hypothetical protein